MEDTTDTSTLTCGMAQLAPTDPEFAERFAYFAGEEVPGELTARQADKAGGVHDPRDVRAAVRHDALPHRLTGKGRPGHPLVVVMAGLFQFQFHIWRPPFIDPRPEAASQAPVTSTV